MRHTQTYLEPHPGAGGASSAGVSTSAHRAAGDWGQPDTAQTERVLLRQFTPADLGDLASILANPDVMRHMGVWCEPMTWGEAEATLSGMMAHWKRKGFGRWAAEEKETGRLMGLAGLRSFGEKVELVYLLGRPFWGRGLATEIALECLRYAFQVKGFAEVVAFTRPANVASRRVLEKVGMRYGGDAEFFAMIAEAGDGFVRPEGAAEIMVSTYSAVGGPGGAIR